MDERKRLPESGLWDREVYEWLQCVVAALVVCLLAFSFFCRVVNVAGNSMVPTLKDREMVLISRMEESYDAGEIVVLRKESFKAEPIVKRVIATAGQTVELDTENGIVYVNGEALDEPYINELTYRGIDYEKPVTVPFGCVYVLGDNRNNSVDSRSDLIGCVDTRCILGRVVFRLWPFDRIGAFTGA